MNKKKLGELCTAASGEGVGFVAVINPDGTITIRRDEEHARSVERTLSEEDALIYLSSFID